MRKITFACSLLLASVSIAQTNFIKNLGKEGVNQPIECSCIDLKGDLTVGYYDATNKETLVFDKYNIATKLWDKNIGKLMTDKPKRNYSKCIYKGDSLLVFASFLENLNIKTGLFYLVNRFEAKKLNEIKSIKGEPVYISDLKIIKNNLVIFGQFDSIINPLKPKESLEIMNVAYYNGVKWMNSQMTNMLKNASIVNTQVATNNETTLIISNDNLFILRYIFPNKWEYVRQGLGSKKPFSAISFIDNKWIATKQNFDSVYYSTNGVDFLAKKIDGPLGIQLNIIYTQKGVLIAEDNPDMSRIYKLDISTNKLTALYQSPTIKTEMPRSSLIVSKASVFYTSTTPIKYNESQFDNLVELNFDFDNTLKYHLITANLFIDKNNNYKKDTGEELIGGTLLNRTFNYTITSTTGVFEDKIPHYTNVEYELVEHKSSECLKLPFTGGLKTNTLAGTNNPLNFPLQRTRFIKNTDIKSWGCATARLLDTIPLSIKITNRDCEITPTNATVIIVLDSNTTFINSVPNYSLINGNTLVYNLKNISATRDSIIKLNVLYSNNKYKIDDYAKHFVQLITPFKLDTLGNFDSIVQKMVYSYDPNAKYSIPQGSIMSDINSIRYFIEFQNEGNDVARRVTIIDTLDTHIPVYEFQMIAGSHAYSVSLKNNVVTWVFDNINLPAKSVDEKGSQGYIVFDAKIFGNMGIGDSIKNKAFIYFDFNEPIVTNLSIIKRIEDLPLIIETDNTLLVYPNPANTEVTIENKINIVQDITIYNMLGQEVKSMKIEPIEKKNIQSISTWPRGMYFVRTGKGKYQKFLVH